MARRDHRHDEALKLAEKVGSAEAARRLGIPAGTVRAWRSQARAEQRGVEARKPATPGQVAEARAEDFDRLAAETFKTVKAARRATQRAIDAGKTTGVKDLSIAVGVLLDQSHKLEALAREQREVRAEISDASLSTLIAIIEAMLETLSLSPAENGAGSRLVFELWAQIQRAFEDDSVPVTGHSGDGSPEKAVALHAPPEMARAIRDELRARYKQDPEVRGAIREELMEELRAPESRQLKPGAAPVTRVGWDEEIVDGEVVPA